MRDRLKETGVQNGHVLIRGDLLNMRFDGINPLPGEMCRLGHPAEQVPAFSGLLPPEDEQSKEAVRVGEGA